MFSTLNFIWRMIFCAIRSSDFRGGCLLVLFMDINCHFSSDIFRDTGWFCFIGSSVICVVGVISTYKGSNSTPLLLVVCRCMNWWLDLQIYLRLFLCALCSCVFLGVKNRLLCSDGPESLKFCMYLSIAYHVSFFRIASWLYIESSWCTQDWMQMSKFTGIVIK